MKRNASETITILTTLKIISVYDCIAIVIFFLYHCTIYVYDQTTNGTFFGICEKLKNKHAKKKYVLLYSYIWITLHCF